VDKDRVPLMSLLPSGGFALPGIRASSRPFTPAADHPSKNVFAIVRQIDRVCRMVRWTR